MALVATQGLWIAPPPPHLGSGTGYLSSLIDATGEKVALIGHVFNSARASKSINKVGFLFGAVTKAGGSGLTLSLQNVDLANGPPYQPDGTQDQTVAITAASVTANTWYQTGALSAARSVSFGEPLAVVIEFDGGGRLGADAYNINNIATASAGQAGMASGVSLFTSSWALQASLPNIILEFNDGTFGTLEYAWPSAAESSVAYNTGTNPDERALEFSVPFACKTDGGWCLLTRAANSDFDMVLYDGTTAIATKSFDGNATATNSNRPLYWLWDSEITLTAGTTYRLALKPTTANNVTIFFRDLNDANHRQALPGGAAWGYTTRNDAGSWAATTTTRVPYIGIRISASDAGGGLAANPLGGFVV